MVSKSIEQFLQNVNFPTTFEYRPKMPRVEKVHSGNGLNGLNGLNDFLLCCRGGFENFKSIHWEFTIYQTPIPLPISCCLYRSPQNSENRSGSKSSLIPMRWLNRRQSWLSGKKSYSKKKMILKVFPNGITQPHGRWFNLSGIPASKVRAAEYLVIYVGSFPS